MPPSGGHDSFLLCINAFTVRRLDTLALSLLSFILQSQLYSLSRARHQKLLQDTDGTLEKELKKKGTKKKKTALEILKIAQGNSCEKLRRMKRRARLSR